MKNNLFSILMGISLALGACATEVLGDASTGDAQMGGEVDAGCAAPDAGCAAPDAGCASDGSCSSSSSCSQCCTSCSSCGGSGSSCFDVPFTEGCSEGQVSACPPADVGAHACDPGTRTCAFRRWCAPLEWQSCNPARGAVPNDCRQPTSWSCDPGVVPPTCGAMTELPPESPVLYDVDVDGSRIDWDYYHDDIHLTRRTPSGAVTWSLAMPVPTEPNSNARSLFRADHAGGAFVIAFTAGATDFDGAHYDPAPSLLVAHVDATGAVTWITGLEVDSDGIDVDAHVDVAGRLSLGIPVGWAPTLVRVIGFDASGAASTVDLPGERVAFSPIGGFAVLEQPSCGVVRVSFYDAAAAPSGTPYEWHGDYAHFAGMVCDANGNVVLAIDQTSPSAAYDDPQLPSPSGTGARLRSISRDGQVRWTRYVFDAQTQAVQRDPFGNVLFVGGGASDVVLGNGQVFPPTNFVAKYGPEGDLVWGQRYAGDAGYYGVISAPDGSFYTTSHHISP